MRTAGTSEPSRPSVATSAGSLTRSRAVWVSAGIAFTMVTMVATARLDHSLDRVGTGGIGLLTLLIVVIPAAAMWSDLLYRSTVVVWTVAVGILALGSFGYFWWPLVMIPFACIGAVVPLSMSIAKAYAWAGFATIVGVLTVPLVGVVARPAYGQTAIVCFSRNASAQAPDVALNSLFPNSWNRSTNPGVDGVGTTTFDDGRRVMFVEFDGGANEADRSRVADAARALPQVTAVVEVEQSPQRGGSQHNPCP